MLALLGPLASAPGSAAAQGVTAEYRISQRAAVVQDLSGTTVEVEYSRPRARGRAPLFGGVVHWGEVWTPGANEATVLELSEDVSIDGHPVPAGRWSMWLIPSSVGPWELLLDPRDSLFHTQRPQPGDDGQIRFAVRTERIEHVEVLTWSFPRVERSGGTLQMAWGGTAVPLDIQVEADLPPLTVPQEEAALYTGTWQVTFLRGPDGEIDPIPPPLPMQIRHAEGGMLVLEYPSEAFAPPPDSADAGGLSAGADSLSAQERERAEARRLLATQSTVDFDLVLVPRARGMFLLGFVEEGGLLLDIEHVFHEFDIEDGLAVRLTVRGPNDTVFARGERER